MVDEFTKECLIVKVGRSVTAQDVKNDLIRLFRERGTGGFTLGKNK